MCNTYFLKISFIAAYKTHLLRWEDKVYTGWSTNAGMCAAASEKAMRGVTKKIQM